MYINRSTVSLSIIILIQNRVKDRCNHTSMILSTVTPGYSTDTAGGTTMISSIRIHTPGQLKVGSGKVYGQYCVCHIVSDFSSQTEQNRVDTTWFFILIPIRPVRSFSQSCYFGFFSGVGLIESVFTCIFTDVSTACNTTLSHLVSPVICR